MTFKVLTDDTQKVIYRSNIRSALNSKDRKVRLDPLNDDTSKDDIKKFIRSFNEKASRLLTNDGVQQMGDRRLCASLGGDLRARTGWDGSGRVLQLLRPMTELVTSLDTKDREWIEWA